MSILADSHIAYVNLAIRPDRNDHMRRELDRVGLKAHRMDAYTPEDVLQRVERWKCEKMLSTTPGALGCYMSQLSIILKAKRMNKHATVFEDDIVFADDYIERVEHASEYLKDKRWDVMFWGGTHHIEPVWHKTGHQMDLPCDCELNCDWEPTSDPQITRVFGMWGTYSYTVNVKSIPKVALWLSELMPQSIGIDFSFIAMQPKIFAYCMNPGAVKQIDNESNIGKGRTVFSNFSRLGPHWFKQKL